MQQCSQHIHYCLTADSLLSALLPWFCNTKSHWWYSGMILFLITGSCLLLYRCLYLPTLSTVMGSSADQSVSGGTGMGKHFDSPTACWEHWLPSPSESIQQCKKGQHISYAFQNISVSVSQTSSELCNLYCSAKWGIGCSFVVWYINIGNTNVKQASKKSLSK